MIKVVFSGRIVGHSISDRMQARLAVNAPDSAAFRRRDMVGYVVYSDRGSQIRSRKFVHTLNWHHLIGRWGNSVLPRITRRRNLSSLCYRFTSWV